MSSTARRTRTPSPSITTRWCASRSPASRCSTSSRKTARRPRRWPPWCRAIFAASARRSSSSPCPPCTWRCATRSIRAALIERVLEHVTDDRAAFEPYAWVRTGFAQAWVHAGQPLPAPALRALHVARAERPRFATLARWQRTEERLGPAGAEALAFTAASAIEARAGRPRWLAFARATIAREPPPAALAVIDLRLDPIAARLPRETALTPEALDAAMLEQIARWRASERARRLARVPRLSASIAM